MRKTISALLLALAAAAAAVCSAEDSGIPPPGREVRITARPSAGFTIDLPANPTTGHDWQLLEDYDKKIVVFSAMKAIARDAAAAREGAPVTEQWSFRTKSAGRTSLRLVYRRSWEPEIVSTMTYTVTVK